MARLFSDLFILAVLSKEFWQFAAQQILPLNYFVLGLFGLSIFLGMASDQSQAISIVRDPIRHLIRTGIAIVSLLIYLQFQVKNGILYQFIGIFLVTIILYSLGRFVGLAWRAVWIILGILIAVYLYYITNLK